jgi:hypothetical protein
MPLHKPERDNPSLMSIPDLLFKYVGSQPHHLDILRTLQIRFTQPDDLNDPHDCIPGIVAPSDIGAFVDAVMAREPANGKLATLSPEARLNARNTLVAQYQSDPDELVERCFDIVRKNINQAGVLSLTTSNENLVLWAHYGDSHRGFVLGFRPGFAPLVQQPQDIQGEGELRPVVYATRAVVAIDEFHLAPDTLYQKDDRWRYEDEWRVVRRLAHCDAVKKDSAGTDKYFMCRVDPAGLARVDIGEFASDDTVRAVWDATAPGTPLEHVAVYRARMNAGRTAFKFQSLK